MYYHARLEYNGGESFWWNQSKESLVRELLIPFINGQIIPINANPGHVLLNMKNITYLRIYKTADELPRSHPLVLPQEAFEPDFEDNDCTGELINEVKQMQAQPQLTSLLQKAFSAPKKQVFVIMKFGDKHLNSAYEGVIKPAIEEFGFKALRVDEIQDSSKITDQILENIATSQYIIADLSGERPNCYYETGFAHALGKEMILTIRKQDAVHFDLVGYRFIQWETEAELRHSLRERLRSLTNKRG